MPGANHFWSFLLGRYGFDAVYIVR